MTDTPSKPFHPVVKELDEHIKNTPGWSKAFQDGVEKAQKSGVVEMQNIGTTEAFLKKINEFLYWIPRENEEGRDLYNRICLFYFVMDQPSIVGFQDPITPKAIKENSWLSQWLHRYAKTIGTYLDDPKSIENIETFKKSKPYNMQEALEPRGGWRDFNDFFARSLKPGQRPIAAISDPTVIVSPADSTYGGQWEIRSDSGVTIKGLHWEIAELLKDCPHAHEFKGGLFIHSLYVHSRF